MSFFISRKLLLIFTLLFSSFSFSQMDFEWASGLSNETPLGGDVVTTDMHVDNNNNTFLAGNFKGAAKFGLPGNDTTILSLGGDDVFVAKFDPLGNLLFAHRIGGPLNDKCVAISLDTIGNICISGYYTGTVDFDVSSSVVNLVSTASEGFIAKYDANMNHIWSNSIGSNLYESIVDMDVHTNGDVYITGSFADSLDLDPSLSNSYWIYENGYPFDMFLAKYDSNGSFVWGKGYI